LGKEAGKAIQVAELVEVGHARSVTDFYGKGKPAFDMKARAFRVRTVESYPLKNAMNHYYHTT
jgi:hypothetical protein